MKLFRGYLQNNLVDLHKNNVRVRFLGDPAPLAGDIRALMDRLVDMIKDNTGLRLNIAINYGGRDELLRAFHAINDKIAAGTLAKSAVTEDTITEHLDTRGQNDPDLIIRTAGEMRLSNFMTWQSAYSEFAFVNETWPEISLEVY